MNAIFPWYAPAVNVAVGLVCTLAVVLAGLWIVTLSIVYFKKKGWWFND